MFWTFIIVTAPTLFLLKTAIDYIYYPDPIINRTVMQIGWNAMELCTKAEIYVTRLYNQYVPTLLNRTPPQPIIKFICDGDEIQTYSITEFMKKRNDIGQINYDFMLYETPIIKRDEYAKYDNYITRYETIKDVLYIEYTSLKCFELNMIQMTINDAETPASRSLRKTLPKLPKYLQR